MEDLKAQIERLELLNEKYVQALNLIAAPMRPDGTFNRCREACQKLATEALTVHCHRNDESPDWAKGKTPKSVIGNYTFY